MTRTSEGIDEYMHVTDFGPIPLLFMCANQEEARKKGVSRDESDLMVLQKNDEEGVGARAGKPKAAKKKVCPRT